MVSGPTCRSGYAHVVSLKELLLTEFEDWEITVFEVCFSGWRLGVWHSDTLRLTDDRSPSVLDEVGYSMQLSKICPSRKDQCFWSRGCVQWVKFSFLDRTA